MVIQNPDGSLVRTHGHAVEKQTYYAELPRHRLGEQAPLFEQLLTYAIDVLGARHIEVRVLDPDEVR